RTATALIASLPPSELESPNWDTAEHDEPSSLDLLPAPLAHGGLAEQAMAMAMGEKAGGPSEPAATAESADPPARPERTEPSEPSEPAITVPWPTVSVTPPPSPESDDTVPLPASPLPASDAQLADLVRASCLDAEAVTGPSERTVPSEKLSD